MRNKQNWQTFSQTYKKKREKNQINKIRNEKEVTTDNAEIQRIIRDYYEQLYGNKMDNLEETDRFLEKFNLWRLNQEETEIMINPITSTEIEAVIKKSPKNQNPRTRWLHRRILSNTQNTANAYPSKTFRKCRGRNTSKLILRGHHHSTKTRQRQHTKKKTTGQYHWWT